MGDFFSFKKMITPVIIEVLFLVGVMLSVIVGLLGIFLGLQIASVRLTLLGLVLLLAGPPLIRVYCELVIIPFQIHDSLLQIDKNTRPMADHAETKIP